MNAREQFCAVLFNGPLLKGDCIVLLEGDGEARIPTTVEMFRQGAAPRILVTGGLDNPPFCLSAHTLAAKLMGLGVAPSAIDVDADAMNTWEQAHNTLVRAQKEGWKRLLLVASPFHAPRAFLTFLGALLDRGLDDDIHLVIVPAAEVPWFQVPEGETVDRVELLAREFAKCGEYEGVASWAEGLAYLKAWEGR